MRTAARDRGTDLRRNGDRDGLFPAIDSAVLAREIPRSQLGVYPDSGHAFLFQYLERVVDDITRFLG